MIAEPPAREPSVARPLPPPAPRAVGVRWALVSVVGNLGLAGVKLVAGIVGSSYALVADAVESMVDVVGSLAVLGGLRLAAREPNEAFPYGYGKAEPLAALAVGIVVLGAAAGIAVQAVREILTPHRAPAPFTLVVLVVVILVKELLHRRVERAGRAAGSLALEVDAFHHRADSLTSAAAALGIGAAVIGGPSWAPADDWAALFAAAIIAWNGHRILRLAAAELLDRSAPEEVVEAVRTVAAGVRGVDDVEKLTVRSSGQGWYVDIHVHADPAMSLRRAHDLSGAVKRAIQGDVPRVFGVLVHMEPSETTGE